MHAQPRDAAPPELQPVDPVQASSARRHYHLVDGSTTLANITLLHGGEPHRWTLPTWLQPTTAVSWRDLVAAQRQLSPTAGPTTAWQPASGRPGEQAVQWLQAVTYPVTTPLPFATELPTAAAAIDLAGLIHASDPGPVVGPAHTLGQTIDLTLALFAGRWGPVLGACSCLATGRGGLMGGIITTLYGDTPLIAAIAASSHFVAHELVLTVLDALCDLGYGTVNLLLTTDSPWLPLLIAAGFTRQAVLVEASLPPLA